MLKTKARFKLLLALGIMILAICVFNMNTVNAATQEELQEMLDVIPSEITLDITELEAMTIKDGCFFEKRTQAIENKIKEILTQNNFSVADINISDTSYPTDYANFYKGIISIGGKQKTISLVYSNSNQKNSSDEQTIKNIKIESPKYYETNMDFMKKLENNEIDFVQELLNKYYSKYATDNSIKIITYTPQGGSDGCLNMEMQVCVAVLKNGFVYNIKNIGWEVTAPSINVPSTVADSELNNYIINAVKEYYPEYANRITKVEKGANSNTAFSNIPNIYTISTDTQYDESYLIVKTTPKITLDNTETNIKLETSEGVIPSNTILEVASITEGTTYNTVKTALTNISKFKVFDINLLSDGVKIQPNGKVKISIPVPAEFDKSNLVVYRVEENGDKIEYTVTVNGDVATFETDHFSTYVLAEKETTQNTENTNNKTDRKKDDTPKTGTISSIYFMIPVAVISATGIIAFRRKETK